MKHASNRRSRGRSNGRRYPNQKGGVFESNGPEVKVRGTPQQVQEKYLALARDAQSSGDRVQAEAYFQHAEHYLRIMTDDEDRERGGRDQHAGDGNGHADEEQAPSRGRGRGRGGNDRGESASGGESASADESASGGDSTSGGDDASASRGGDGGGNGGGRGRGRGRGRRQAKSQDEGAAADPASQPQPDIVPPAAS